MKCSCGADTRRKDGNCQNCHFLTFSELTGRNTYFDLQVMDSEFPDALRKCVDCGNTDLRVLRITKKNGTAAGEQQPIPSKARDRGMFALHVQGNVDNHFLRCENCYDKHKRSTGRPAKYKTLEEKRAELYRQQWLYRQQIKERCIEEFGGKCLECGGRATRILYVGPPGQGPKTGEYRKTYLMLLKNENFRANFRNEYRAFCASHGDQPFGRRVQEAKLIQTARDREEIGDWS